MKLILKIIIILFPMVIFAETAVIEKSKHQLKPAIYHFPTKQIKTEGRIFSHSGQCLIAKESPFKFKDIKITDVITPNTRIYATKNCSIIIYFGKEVFEIKDLQEPYDITFTD